MIDKVCFFRALGDETRYQLLTFLMGREHTVNDFFPSDDKEMATMSRHIEILSEAGIIKESNVGGNIVYSITDKIMWSKLFKLGLVPTDIFSPFNNDTPKNIKEIVREKYGQIATEGGNCRCNPSCCTNGEFDPLSTSTSIGYSEEDINVAPEANMGLGCGNPTALGEINEGETVLDMGSGAGIDSFLAAKMVGPTGKVIGVDMTEDMIIKARENAQIYEFNNVEFRWGDIENMPVETGSVDVVLSNCVINLVLDKRSAFREAYRALKSDGRLYISDIVLTGKLTEEQLNDPELISGCVANAIPPKDYLDMIEDAGFKIEKISENHSIGKDQYGGLPVASVHIKARKK